MPVRATINGETWEFDTAAEAAEFKRAMMPDPPHAATTEAKTASTSKAIKVRPASAAAGRGVKQSDGQPRAISGFTWSRETRALLEQIRKAPEGGLPSGDLAQRLGMNSASDMPVLMMNFTRQAQANGLEPNAVIRRVKGYEKGVGKSHYLPGPRLDEALRQTGALFEANQ